MEQLWDLAQYMLQVENKMVEIRAETQAELDRRQGLGLAESELR